MFKLSVPITPKPAPRPRFGNFGNVYMPEWYKAYINDIATYCSWFNPIIFNNPVIFEGYLELSLTFRKKTPITRKQYGDLDNLIKGVMDALTGIAYKDDSQVIRVAANKVQDDNEGIDIYIQYL